MVENKKPKSQFQHIRHALKLAHDAKEILLFDDDDLASPMLLNSFLESQSYLRENTSKYFWRTNKFDFFDSWIENNNIYVDTKIDKFNLAVTCYNNSYWNHQEQ